MQVMSSVGIPLTKISENISTGWYHSLFLKSNGTVLAVGKNIDSQLGDGTAVNRLASGSSFG